MADESEPTARPEIAVDRLVNSGVLDADGADALTPSERLLEVVDEKRALLSASGSEHRVSTLEEAVGDETQAAALLDSASDEILAEYLALDEMVVLDHRDRVRVLIALGALMDPSLDGDGVPDAFVPLSAERLSVAVKLSPRAVTYVWSDDCDPCELVRSDFDEFFERPPDDIGLFAVNGPHNAEFLYDEYQVDGAPTCLFFLHGVVDARLRGAHEPTVLRAEIEKLRELS